MFGSRSRHLVAVSYTHLDVYKRQVPPGCSDATVARMQSGALYRCAGVFVPPLPFRGEGRGEGAAYWPSPQPLSHKWERGFNRCAACPGGNPGRSLRLVFGQLAFGFGQACTRLFQRLASGALVTLQLAQVGAGEGHLGLQRLEFFVHAGAFGAYQLRR